MSVAAEFARRGIVQGGTLMLYAEPALEMVERARELGVPILGVDGFWVTETTTQPDMEHSVDLGSGGVDSWDAAAGFIQSRSALGLMFEVVADEDTEDVRKL
jgi:hypothetical protein